MIPKNWNKYLILFYFLEAVIACDKGIKFFFSVEVCVPDVQVLTYSETQFPKVVISNSMLFLICIGLTAVSRFVSPSAHQCN